MKIKNQMEVEISFQAANHKKVSHCYYYVDQKSGINSKHSTSFTKFILRLVTENSSVEMIHNVQFENEYTADSHPCTMSSIFGQHRPR